MSNNSIEFMNISQKNDVQKAIKSLELDKDFSNLKKILLEPEDENKNECLNYLIFIQYILVLNDLLKSTFKKNEPFYLPIDLNQLKNVYISSENPYVLKEILDNLKNSIVTQYSDANLAKQQQSFNLGFGYQLGGSVLLTGAALFGFVKLLMVLLAAHHLMTYFSFMFVINTVILAAGLMLIPVIYQKSQEEGKILQQHLNSIKNYRNDIQTQEVPSLTILV